MRTDPGFAYIEYIHTTRVDEPIKTIIIIIGESKKRNEEIFCKKQAGPTVFSVHS